MLDSFLGGLGGSAGSWLGGLAGGLLGGFGGGGGGGGGQPQPYWSSQSGTSLPEWPQWMHDYIWRGPSWDWRRTVPQFTQQGMQYGRDLMGGGAWNPMGIEGLLGGMYGMDDGGLLGMLGQGQQAAPGLLWSNPMYGWNVAHEGKDQAGRPWPGTGSTAGGGGGGGNQQQQQQTQQAQKSGFDWGEALAKANAERQQQKLDQMWKEREYERLDAMTRGGW